MTTEASFEVIPAIDLLGGRCVRLSQGRYDDATVYGEDPAAVAADFVTHPIPRVHVVDLDGAKAGRPCNTEVVRAICRSAGEVPVQLGGGIRHLDTVAEAIEAGVARVILGTVALRDPELVRAAAKAHPGRIAVGIDARDGRVAVEGWTSESEADATQVAARFEDAGVAAIIYTDIDRDGMGTGPNLSATAALAERISIPVIASGGVGSDADVERAAGYAGRGISGIIVGRAIYTGAVDLPALARRFACS